MTMKGCALQSVLSFNAECNYCCIMMTQKTQIQITSIKGNISHHAAAMYSWQEHIAGPIMPFMETI